MKGLGRLNSNKDCRREAPCKNGPSIIDLVASILTHNHLSYYSEHPFAIKGMFQQSIYRSLGLSAHLAWARLLIDRTNEQAKYPDAQSNDRKHRDSGDDEAIAHENYFNPESGFAASERTTGQSP